MSLSLIYTSQYDDLRKEYSMNVNKIHRLSIVDRHYKLRQLSIKARQTNQKSSKIKRLKIVSQDQSKAA